MSQIRLPARIYTTPAGAKSSDDLQYGDMTEQQLRSVYHLDDVSARVNPYTLTKIEEIKRDPSMEFSPFMDRNFPDRPASFLVDYFPKIQSRFIHLHEERKNILSTKECSDILFDEMRELSKPFALYGVYSGLIVKMINHMQKNSGLPFRDYLLDRALEDQIRRDFSGGSNLNRIAKGLSDNIDWNANILLESSILDLNAEVRAGRTPKFTRFKDKFNGMGITVHDTYSTQITLNYLSIKKGEFEASLHYKVQDHFGLDKWDIMKSEYHTFRFFRVWFFLQHYNKMAFKPFVTEMECTIRISGHKP